MEDILADRRSKGDLCWVLKPWNQDVGDFSSKLLPTSLLDCVKTDPAVATEVAQLPAAEQTEAWRRIEQVFTEMHHSFSVGSVRRVGYSLAKIFKQLYDTVQVERAGIEQVRALPSGVPTLYLPTHRSYVDFLLVSYVCFHYGLPLPVIAAGMDFLSMLCVGDILRSCGAFFIRRRLNGDRLYAAVLRAYVQALALSSPQPAEFFIEGTRSRSGKPLPPRTGLLSAYLELYHSGRIPDLHIVPISISYERVLEENLYAYEMLGTPKPAESTGRLVGAVSVLAENYGSVHVRLLGVHSLRAAGAPCSRSTQLAAAVLRHQLCGARLSASCLLLAALQLAGGRAHLPQLLEVAGFIGQRLSEAHPQLSVEEVTADSARRTLHMHHSLLSVSADRVVELKPPSQPASKLHRPAAGPRLRAATVTAAIPRIRLQLYVNPLLPHIAGPALAQLAIDAGRSEARRTLYELMAVEFPTLERSDAATTTAIPEPPHTDAPRWLQLRTELIRPYLEAYRATVAAILESLPDAASPGGVQHWTERHVDLRRPEAHLCLCRDVIANCTTALVRMGAGTRNNGGDTGTTNGNGSGNGNGTSNGSGNGSNGTGNGTSNGSGNGGNGTSTGTSNVTGNGTSTGSGNGSGNGTSSNGSGNGTSTAVQWRRERLEAVAALLDSVCGHGQRRMTAAAARL